MPSVNTNTNVENTDTKFKYERKSTSAENNSETATRNTKGTLGKDSFLQLLVCEMQNQDPLSPTDNTQQLAQLASFSQVEELQNLGNSLNNMKAYTYVGKNVDITTYTTDGKEIILSGKVDYVKSESGTTYVSVKDTLYDAENVTAVYNDGYVKESTEKNTDTATKDENKSTT